MCCNMAVFKVILIELIEVRSNNCMYDVGGLCVCVCVCVCLSVCVYLS